MKRTALFLALIEITLSVLLYLFGKSVVSIACVLLWFAAFGCFILRRRLAGLLKVTVLLISSSLFCMYLLFYNFAVIEKAEALAGKSGTVTCTVTEEPFNKGGYTSFEVKTSKDKSKNSNLCGEVKFRLFVLSNSAASSADIGDIITADVKFEKNDDAYRRLNYADGMHISAFVTSAEITGHKNTFYSYCVGIRREVRNCINDNFSGDTAALLNGLVLGDISRMSDSLYSDFVVCGVCHITAVSGMHIGALCMMFSFVLGLFLSRRKAAALSFIPLVMVVLITGMSPSAVRAGIMCGITFLGMIIYRETDGLNSLGIAMAVMLIANPFYICSLSFQLSCSATAGVIIASKYSCGVTQKISRVKPRILKAVIMSAVTVVIQSVGAVVFTLPFQIIELGFVSVIAPLSSLAVCAAAVYALTVSVIGIILYFIPYIGFISVVPFTLSKLLLNYICDAIRVLAKIPFSYIAFGSRSAEVWLGLSLALIGIWVLLNKVGGVRTITLMISALLVVSLWSDEILGRSVAEASVLDVGDGFCTVVTYNYDCVVIGCGDESSDYYELKSYMKCRNITKISAVLMPSDDEMCSGGLKSVYNKMSPKLLVAPEGYDGALGYGDKCRAVYDNETFSVGGINVIARFNGYGCVYEMRCAGKSFMVGCTGYGNGNIALDGTDFAVSGRALPENSGVPLLIVSGTEYLTENERALIENSRVVCVKDKTVSVKFKQGKGLTVYAE